MFNACTDSAQTHKNTIRSISRCNADNQGTRQPSKGNKKPGV